MAKGKFSQPRNRNSNPAPAPAPKVPPRREPAEQMRSLEDILQDEPVQEEPVREMPVQPRLNVDPEAQAINDAIQEMNDADDSDFEDEDSTFPEKVLAFFSQNRKMVLVGVCALVLVAVIGVIAFVFLSSSADPYDGKILNNVTVAGIHVGGMTRSEAEKAVTQAIGDPYATTDMVIQLPDEALRLSPADTGATLDVKSAVKAAYDYGRTGTEAERQAAYNASHTSNHTIGLLPYLNLDQEAIYLTLQEYAEQFGCTLTQSTYEMDGEMPELSMDKYDESAPCQTLMITIGTPGLGLDIDAIFEDVLDAYSMCEFLVEVEEVSAEAVPDPLDLEAIYEEFYIEPVDATVDMKTFESVPGSYGYGFDLEKAQQLVEEAEYGTTIGIPMEYISPEVMDDEVLFQDVLGSCETPHTNNENRNTNLKLACEALNGLILQPGEEFSYNEALGERTAAKGYKPAPAYSGNDLVDSIGGGICQVSSTLYYSTLIADLEIVFRINHGFASSYIDYGMDATVSWGYPDFQFKNNTNFPIKIEAEVSDGYVKVKILGTDEKDYYVKMEYEITGMEKPDTIYEEHTSDEGYKDGQVLQGGTTGIYVKTYKCKYSKETDELISRDFEARSNYKTVDKIVVKIVDKEEPTEATKPTETTAPSETTQPSETTKPTESTAPAETTKPTETNPPETTAPPTTEAPTTAPPPETDPPADGASDGGDDGE